MRIIPIVLFFLPILHSFAANGQNTTIDSLKLSLSSQKEDTNKVNTLNSLGMQLMIANDYKNSYSLSLQALRLARKINFIKGQAYAFENIGTFLENEKKYEEARKNYDTAIYYFGEIEDKNAAANVYTSIASSYNQEDNSPEALKNIYKALNLYEETGNDEGIQYTYLILGGNNLAEKDYDSAEKNLIQALQYFTKTGAKEGIAITNTMLAEIDYAKERYGAAFQRDSIALALLNETGSIMNKGGVLNNMGNIYERLGDAAFNRENLAESENQYREALNRYRAAIEMHQMTGADQFIFETYTEIGNVYTKLMKLDSARFYLTKSLNYYTHIDENLKKNHNSEFEQLYLAISKMDSAAGDMTKAYKSYKIYVTYRDSNYAEEKAKRLQQVKQQYEFDKKENVARAEQGKKDAESKRTRNLQYSAIAIVFLAALFLFWSNRQKQKAKSKIENAYSELKATQSQLIQSEKMASLGELTAGIAHEIQNPLNFVNNFSEVNKELLIEMKEEMTKGNLDSANGIANDLIANEEKIYYHGKRADNIVKGMLQHSRASSGQRVPTDINALADEYLTTFLSCRSCKRQFFQCHDEERV